MGDLLRFIAESNLATVVFGFGAFMFLIATVRLEGRVEVTPLVRVVLAVFGLLLMGMSFASGLATKQSDTATPFTGQPTSTPVVIVVTATPSQPTADVVTPDTPTAPQIPPTSTPVEIAPTPVSSTPTPLVVPPTPALDEIARFEVLATVPKNRTGISVTQGDVMHFEYLDGQWTGDKNEPGLTTGCGFTFHDPVEEHLWPLPPEQRGSALIGYIGSQPFWIGCDPIDFVAATSGELYLGMSDCRDCFGDNEGALYVKISITRK